MEISENSIYAGTSLSFTVSKGAGKTWVARNNRLTGWRVVQISMKGNSGTIRTTQGRLYSRSTSAFWQILEELFPNSGMIFKGDSLIAGTGRGILFSTDFGESWERIPTNSDIDAGGLLLEIIDGDIYYRKFNELLILRDKTGNTEVHSIDTEHSILAIELHNEKIFVSTFGRELFVSEDGGSTWSELSLPEVITDCCQVADLI